MSQNRITYTDYCELKDDRRYEVIDGVIHLMSAPSVVHQRVAGEIFSLFHTHLRGKGCRPFFAPFDVRLPFADEDGNSSTNVVQPDLVVICDKTKLQGTGCVGAPDLVVEILSPSSARLDAITKLKLYERAGVKEYWVVDPFNNTISRLCLEEGKFGEELLVKEDEVMCSVVLPDLVFPLKEVFGEETESVY